MCLRLFFKQKHESRHETWLTVSIWRESVKPSNGKSVFCVKIPDKTTNRANMNMNMTTNRALL